jgi:hypothetical protein
MSGDVLRLLLYAFTVLTGTALTLFHQGVVAARHHIVPTRENVMWKNVNVCSVSGRLDC